MFKSQVELEMFKMKPQLQEAQGLDLIVFHFNEEHDLPLLLKKKKSKMWFNKLYHQSKLLKKNKLLEFIKFQIEWVQLEKNLPQQPIEEIDYLWSLIQTFSLEVKILNFDSFKKQLTIFWEANMIKCTMMISINLLALFLNE